MAVVRLRRVVKVHGEGRAALRVLDGLDLDVEAGELVAVTGRSATPPLFETMAVLGKEVCRRRLRRAADVLKTRPGSPAK